MIKRKIINYIYRIYVRYGKKNKLESPVLENNSYNQLFDSYKKFVKANDQVSYRVFLKNAHLPIMNYKFVGGIFANNSFILTPNKAESVMCVTAETESQIGRLPEGDYKWSGESIYQNRVYFFPRKSPNMLILDNSVIRQIQGNEYGREHHYGGVRWNNLIIQPPRDSSHFLIWDIDREVSFTIKICPEFLAKNFRYNCSVLHPNGYIYFFPENGRVIKFDPRQFKFCFVGNWINTMIFDAKILPDENIYGYSTNNTGILKFNVRTETAEILHRDKRIASYGTKLGINGKLYSIPGSGSCIWEYDYTDDVLVTLCDLHDEGYAKYAGGCTDPEGNIYAAPAFADQLLNIIPSKNVKMPEDIYNTFWVDSY